ncbi:hypothetical protein BDN71DRAFT_1513794 [Pleurotus eryngii]|uniref:Uncharacterized protein n=1 Tax=Pleurotus eryngii TaxID=5323 RepID=A0A9P6D9F7_PLEER|nr:hypothetical protein BDN71DRAFT_1513794 [Pleurotus eryngii]
MTDKFKLQDLSFHQIQLLKSFIEVVMKKPSEERIDFIINHAECTAKREIYTTWFRNRVAPRVNALVESAMHECGFHPQSVLATQELDNFPPANILMNACLTPVAVEMFGDVVMSGDILIDKAIAVHLKTLLVHNVSRMGKAYICAGSVVDKKVRLMNDVLKVIDEAGPNGASLAVIRATLQASKNVEQLTSWYPNVQLEAEENIVKLKKAVRHAMKQPQNDFDMPVRSQKSKANENVEAARKKGCKICITQAEMANEMEVARMLQSIATHLKHMGNLENCPTEANRHAYTEFLEEGDLGVEIMSKSSFEQLTVLLSFVGGRPGNWNTYVCKDGVTAWHLGLMPSNPLVTRRGPSNMVIEITLDMFANRGPGFKPI